MVSKKVLSIFALAVLVLAIGVVSADAVTNINNISITSFSNNTVYVGSNASTITVNWTINKNYTSLVAANISLQVDDTFSIICYGNGTLAYNHIEGMGTPNGTQCLTPTTLGQGINYTLNLNLSEGVHKIVVNISTPAGMNASTAAGTVGDGQNDTMVVLNYDSIAFATGNPVNFANLSSVDYTANVTFNSGLFVNITYTLYNFTAGQVVYNKTFADSISLEELTGSYANYSGANYTFAALPNNWYTLNVTINGGNATLRGYNKTITRYFVLDTVAPTASIDSCDGWADQAKQTVLQSSTFTCSCTGTDENATSGLTYSYSPEDTPRVSIVQDEGYTCTAIDPAGNNNGTTATQYYTVIGETLSESSGGSTSSSSGTTYKVTEEQLDEGMESKLAANDKFEINFQPSSAGAVETHTVTVSSVDANSVTVVIASDPVTIKVTVGEEKKVDIDGDGVYDLLVKLNGIEDGKADLEVMSTEGEVPEGEGRVSGGTGMEPEEEPEGMSMWIWIVAILVIIVIAAVVMASKKKK